MPALWKSILHKDKTGYASYPSNSYQLGSSSAKQSQQHSKSRDRESNTDAKSDENVLIPRQGNKLTTNVRANALPELRQSLSDYSSNPDRDRGCGELQIVRTVEVNQFVER